MNEQDLRRIWAQIDLSPEADDRIRGELMQALCRPERRGSLSIRLRRVERRLSKTMLTAIVIGALLTVAAIAAAAGKLPLVRSAQQPRLTESETPSPTPTAAEEKSFLDHSLPSDEAEAAPPPEATPFVSEEAAEALQEPADTEGPSAKETSEDTKDRQVGWKWINGRIYYFLDDETTATGWQMIDGKTYYFLDSGIQAYGWKEINGSWYFFDYFEGGAMTTGWLTKLETGMYYFGEDGRMATGWQEINGNTYYFLDSGVQAYGWKEINGSWYFFDYFEGGAMATGWLTKLETGKYYFGEDGRMATGWQKIDRNMYYFLDSGARAAGWQEIDGAWYYFDLFPDTDTVCVPGAMATGWQEIDGEWYYFREDGALDPAAHDPDTSPLPSGDDEAPNNEWTSAEPPDPEAAPPASDAPEERPAEEPPASDSSVEPAPFDDSVFADTEAQSGEEP